jgi:hypothetical protein
MNETEPGNSVINAWLSHQSQIDCLIWPDEKHYRSWYLAKSIHLLKPRLVHLAVDGHLIHPTYILGLPLKAMSDDAMATTDGAEDKDNKKMATSVQRPDRPHAEAVPEEHLRTENDGFLSRATNIAVSSTLISQTVLNLI